MRQLFTSLPILSLIVLSACAGEQRQPVEAENTAATWSLKARQSYVHYTTVKQDDIAEPNSFSIFTGSVEPSGAANVSIALNSVQTNVDTRDERMKRLVFKTSDYPMANISTTIPMQVLSALAEGKRQSIEEEITVSMAGVKASFDANFMVTRLGPNLVLVESERPVYVQASDFEFEGGIAELKNLANLDSITPVVPVSFSLVFDRS